MAGKDVEEESTQNDLWEQENEESLLGHTQEDEKEEES